MVEIWWSPDQQKNRHSFLTSESVILSGCNLRRERERKRRREREGGREGEMLAASNREDSTGTLYQKEIPLKLYSNTTPSSLWCKVEYDN